MQSSPDASPPDDVAGRIVRRRTLSTSGRTSTPARCGGCSTPPWRSSAAAVRRPGPGWPTSSLRPVCPMTPSTATFVPRTTWSRPSSRMVASACGATWPTTWPRRRRRRARSSAGCVAFWPRPTRTSRPRHWRCCGTPARWVAVRRRGAIFRQRAGLVPPARALQRARQRDARARCGAGRPRHAGPALGLPLAGSPADPCRGRTCHHVLASARRRRSAELQPSCELLGDPTRCALLHEGQHSLRVRSGRTRPGPRTSSGSR